MKRIAVMTSGGDAPGMNACIRAVVRCGIDKGMEVYGVKRGFEGLIEGELYEMTRRDVGSILHRGGTKLATSRSDRFMTPEGQEQAMNVLKTFAIDGLVIIGGNGSLTGGLALARRGIAVIGAPGTIDNDLAYTDYTIGFDTAVNTVLDAVSKIRDTSSAHSRNTVVEVMGRNCGDIAKYAGITCGAEAVLVPEEDYDIREISQKVLEGINRGKKHSIIIKAEGSKGTTEEVTEQIEELTGKDTKMVALSYIQRGGSPTAMDRMIATLTGARAVDLLSESDESWAVGIKDNKVVHYPLEEALGMERNRDDDYLMELVDVLSR